MSAPPRLTLYTANPSIYGQQVNILLCYLQVPFSQVEIFLDRPREPWYLAINPQGLVPTLEIEDAITGRTEYIVGSALICYFLLDLAPSWGEEYETRANAMMPRNHDFATAMKKHQQRLFLDIYFEKLRAAGRALQTQRTEEARIEFLAVAKQLNPLCPQPGCYFGNSETISLVEVLTGPYLMRVESGLRWGFLLNAVTAKEYLRKEAPNFYAWLEKLATDEKVKAGTWDDALQRAYAKESLAKAGIVV